MNTTENGQAIHVVFRKFVKGGVVALFPYEREPDGKCRFYQQVRHCGTVDYLTAMQTSVGATPDESASLHKELQEPPFNYKLHVIKRRGNNK